MNKFIWLFLFLLTANIRPCYGDPPDDAILPFLRADIARPIAAYPIASPLKGGPLKILFLGRYDRIGRLSAVIPASLECRFQAVYTGSRNRLGLENARDSRPQSVFADDVVAGIIAELLGEPWDAIWLDYDPGALPDEARRLLLGAVAGGAGLVYVGEKNDIKPFATGGKIDTGRLDVVSYRECKVEFVGMRERGIIAVMPPDDSANDPLAQGDYISCGVNALVFVSGRSSETYIAGVKHPKKLEHESMHFMNFRLDFSRKSDSGPMVITCRYRNEKGRSEHSSSETFNINKGKSFVLLDMPLLPIGEHSLDISVSDDEGVHILAGMSFRVTAVQRIKEVTMWTGLVREGGVIAGSVELSAELEESMAFTSELVDCRGRILQTNRLDVITKRFKTPFSFLVKDILDNVAFVRIHYFKSNELVQTVEKSVYINRPFEKRQFSFVVSEPAPAAYLDPLVTESLRDAGVTAFAPDFSDIPDEADLFDRIVALSSDNSRVVPVLDYFPVITEGKLSRDYRNSLSRFRALADTLRRFMLPGTAVRFPPRESLGEYADDTVLPSFATFLRGRYSSVERLNAAWLTTHASLDDARPVSLEIAGKSGRFRTWLDSADYGESLLFDAHQSMTGEITGSESHVRTGVYGFPHGAVSFDTFDPGKWINDSGIVITGQVSSLLEADTNAVTAAVSSFTSGIAPMYLLIGGESYRPGNEQLLRAAPWRSLFLGMNGIWWGRGETRLNAPLTPNMLLSPAFGIVTGEVREITSGINVLLSGCERRVDSVAILYSPLSIAAGLTSHDTPEPLSETSNPALASLQSFYHALTDAGFTPVFITEDQIGTWTDDTNAALILPFAQALSDDTAEAVVSFVEAGGTIVADMRTGVMDDSLEMRDKGALDGVFGITESVERMPGFVTGAVRVTDNGMFPESIGSLPECPMDSSVAVSPGGRARSLAAFGDIPAVVVNEFGAGKAVYLNMAAETYERARSEGEGGAFRALLSGILAFGDCDGMESAGISILDVAGKEAGTVSRTIFRDGAVTCIALLPDPRVPAGTALEGKMRILSADRPQPVYDVRRGKFLGITNNVQVSLAPGEAQLYVVLPYRVLKLDVSVDEAIVRTGEHLDYAVTIVPQDASVIPARHVVNIRVLDPEGRERHYFGNTLETEGGVLNGTLPIARNEMHGTWTIFATDIATGKQAERTFIVMPVGKGTVR